MYIKLISAEKIIRSIKRFDTISVLLRHEDKKKEENEIIHNYLKNISIYIDEDLLYISDISYSHETFILPLSKIKSLREEKMTTYLAMENGEEFIIKNQSGEANDLVIIKENRLKEAPKYSDYKETHELLIGFCAMAEDDELPEFQTVDEMYKWRKKKIKAKLAENVY